MGVCLQRRTHIGRMLQRNDGIQRGLWETIAMPYAVVAVGKVPVYRIDRAGAALLGGSLMLAIGVLTPQEAYRAIDFDTITLLLGMMINFSSYGHDWERRPAANLTCGRGRCC